MADASLDAQLPKERLDRFRVEAWMDWFGGFVTRHPGLLRRIGNLETRQLAEELARIEIEAPIYVSGLARSGTTILLECLAEHPDTATHRYRDYPGLLAPVAWNKLSQRLYARRAAAVERAHGDGIDVTPDSPEAMEEMLWMAFHPRCHDPGSDNSVGRGQVAPAFAAFYRDHIRKLLWLRGSRRYLSKGNYNLARLGGLIDLFPDARFIVPIRDPVTHVASLMRQHSLFSQAESRHPAALRYMQRVGHYEFGLDRRPLNLGDGRGVAEVQSLWQQGREVEGWALYWAQVHGALIARLSIDPALREATLLVSYEALCGEPAAMLRRIHAQARLPVADAEIDRLAARIRAPAYYRLPFDAEEQKTIRRLTGETFARLSRLTAQDWAPGQAKRA